jgi:hypothetical protein
MPMVLEASPMKITESNSSLGKRQRVIIKGLSGQIGGLKVVSLEKYTFLIWITSFEVFMYCTTYYAVCSDILKNYYKLEIRSAESPCILNLYWNFITIYGA